MSVDLAGYLKLPLVGSKANWRVQCATWGHTKVDGISNLYLSVLLYLARSQ